MICEAIGASLDDSRHSGAEYSLLCSSSLWDIHQFVFIRSRLRPLVRQLRSGTEVSPSIVQVEGLMEVDHYTRISTCRLIA